MSKITKDERALIRRLWSESKNFRNILSVFTSLNKPEISTRLISSTIGKEEIKKQILIWGKEGITGKVISENSGIPKTTVYKVLKADEEKPEFATQVEVDADSEIQPILDFSKKPEKEVEKIKRPALQEKTESKDNRMKAWSIKSIEKLTAAVDGLTSGMAHNNLLLTRLIEQIEKQNKRQHEITLELLKKCILRTNGGNNIENK